MQNQQLTLFYRPMCLFCRKVISYLDKQGISIPLKDITDDQAELISIGGKAQVPCLVIDGNPLYESDDIIEWFKENWSKPTP